MKRLSFASLLSLFAFLAALASSLPALAQKDPTSRRAPHRARLGLEAGLGVASGDSDGGAFALTFQLGYQASDRWALYYQTGIGIDGWAGDGYAGDGGPIESYVYWPNLAMFDLTIGRALQLGGGAGVDVGSFGVCEDDVCNQDESVARPAFEARLALIVPLPGIRARWGIPISLRFHATVLEDALVDSITLNTGILRY